MKTLTKNTGWNNVFVSNQESFLPFLLPLLVCLTVVMIYNKIQLLEEQELICARVSLYFPTKLRTKEVENS